MKIIEVHYENDTHTSLHNIKPHNSIPLKIFDVRHSHTKQRKSIKAYIKMMMTLV